MIVRPAKTQISLGIRPVWSESLLCAQWVAKDLVYFMRTAKTLIRLAGCPGWSESSLSAHIILLVLPCCGSIITSPGLLDLLAVTTVAVATPPVVDGGFSLLPGSGSRLPDCCRPNGFGSWNHDTIRHKRHARHKNKSLIQHFRLSVAMATN